MMESFKLQVLYDFFLRTPKVPSDPSIILSCSLQKHHLYNIQTSLPVLPDRIQTQQLVQSDKQLTL